MTGFGRARQEFADGRVVTVELKSVNSKAMDLRLRLPNLYQSKEIELRQILGAALTRGKVDFNLHIENTQQTDFSINRTAFDLYYYQLLEIAGNAGIPHGDMLYTVTRMPGVIVSSENEINEEHWQQILDVLQEAIRQFNQFRATEGAVLQQDMKQRVSLIGEYLDAVTPHEKERVQTTRDRLWQNLEQAQLSGKIDVNRYEQEIIYYLEKLDITEEKTRLRQHCVYFLEELDHPTESQGRKLNFILQEMGREINTLGSKANHAAIQRIVVQMKDEAEKIKEQLANIL